MSSELTLKLILEGTEAGLADGRLGLSFFNESFRELLRAYRAIATMLISSAQYEDVNVRAQGRKPWLAEHMDIEIDSITHSSPSTIQFICPVPKLAANRTSELFAHDIVRRSAIELVDAVGAEANGHPRNKYVRRFLERLPAGTQRQSWQLYDHGKILRSIDVGHIHLPPMELVSTGLLRAEGRVTGIHFPPNGEIRVSTATDQWWFRASEEQIETAISLRNASIACVGVQRGGKLTVLWIREQGSFTSADRETRDAYFAKRWAGVLKRLAK